MRSSAAVIAACIACVPVGARAADALAAGRWQSQGTVTEAVMPGMPAAALDAMKRRPLSHSYCLTAEEAAKGARGLFSEGNGSCHYSRFAMKDGRIDAVLQCKAGEGETQLTMRGTYDATSYRTTNVLVMSGPGGKMRMTTTMTGKRTGTC